MFAGDFYREVVILVRVGRLPLERPVFPAVFSLNIFEVFILRPGRDKRKLKVFGTSDNHSRFIWGSFGGRTKLSR